MIERHADAGFSAFFVNAHAPARAFAKRRFSAVKKFFSKNQKKVLTWFGESAILCKLSQMTGDIIPGEERAKTDLEK